jgi:hypothetical protein
VTGPLPARADVDGELALARAARLDGPPENADPAAGPSGDVDPRNFSIILGGPLFQLLRRAHMTGNGLELVRRRVLVIAAFAWLPLLLLTLLQGNALGGAASVPFLKDFEVHVRFLVAVPLLVVAELIVHLRLRPVAFEFLQRSLVPPEELPRFHAAIQAAMRLRNSMLAELVMIALVYALGVPVVWRELAALDVPTWYAQGSGFTWAGFWYAYVSVPMFQFLLLRWYFRIIVWTRFMWHVSRLKLRVSAMHADRMGGLGFLSGTVFAFVPLAMAHGAVVAGTIANRIFHLGTALYDARIEIALVVAFLLLIVLIPITFFAPQIAEVKRVGQRVYGRLAQRYVAEFEERWLPAGRPADDSPLGTGDIQSLADLSNSMETLRATRIVPITRQAVIALALATLLPIAPLLLTVIPAEELATRLLKLLV